jgi:diacylglycerol kinase (ATP)
MRSFTAVINPVSGGGSAPRRWSPVSERLASAGVTVNVELTRSSEHATALAGAAAHRGDVVVAVGGDGLVRDAAAGMVGTESALAIIPAGRGNDLARKLGLPTDPAAQCDMLLHGTSHPIDTLEANGQIALGNAYMGIDSMASAIINGNRWIPGALLYHLAPVRAILAWKPPVYTIVAADQTLVTRAHTVVVANSGAYGRGLRIVPDAKLDDGMLDVMIVGVMPKRQLASFMSQAKHGTHVRRPEVRIIRAREVAIETDRPVPTGIDGEDLGHTPCAVRVRPSALQIIR